VLFCDKMNLMILFYLFIFIFGLCIGSFLNVLIARLPKEEGISGRSHCPKCGHILRWYDLIPVLSFILLKRRCRYCRGKISWQYPIVEISTGLIFLLIFNFQFSIFNQFPNFLISQFLDLFFLFFITSCLIVIFVSDLKYFIIPDEIIWAGVIGTFLYKFFAVWNFKIFDFVENWKLEIENWESLGYYLLAGLATSAFFLAIVLITRGKGMGLGDVKLVFLMGLILGWPQILVALLVAFISGALVGLGLIVAGRAKMKSQIPFGTFLAASTFLVMIWGEKIINAYFKTLSY